MQDAEGEGSIERHVVRSTGSGFESRLAEGATIMPIATVYCPVIRSNVTRVTDLEGQPSKVICSEYQEPTGICRLKKGAKDGGMLSQLLQRVSESTLDTKDLNCVLR